MDEVKEMEGGLIMQDTVCDDKVLDFVLCKCVGH